MSIVSSRLGRRLDQQHRWFDLLRTSVLRMDRATDGLVIVKSTAAADITLRAATLFGIPSLQLDCDQRQVGRAPAAALTDWLTSRLEAVISGSENCHNAAVHDQPLSYVADVSPPLESILSDGFASRDCGAGEEPGNLVSLLADTAYADRVAFAAADRVIVLQSRRGGTVETLSRLHLRDRRRQSVSLMVASDCTTLTAALDHEAAGRYVTWIVEPHGVPANTSPSLKHATPLTAQPATETEGDGPLNRPHDWLCHWTRAQPGPWHDQRQEDWLDELILDCAGRDRSALAALLHIVTTEILKGSAAGVRGDVPVVSWTSVPLTEFRNRRVWRRHRQRYDFELFGIAIRKTVLQHAGAQPVIYGDEDTWSRLSRSERFQFQPSVSAAQNSAIDWTVEQEWRYPGDLVLAGLQSYDVTIFVGNARAAAILQRHSRWNVIVVP